MTVAGSFCQCEDYPRAVEVRDRYGGTVMAARYLGSATRVVVDLGGGDPPDGRSDVAVLVPGGHAVPDPGRRVGLGWDAGALHPMAGE